MNAKELREKFEIDLKNLQDNCQHTEIEEMEYHWAPGHSGGYVFVCKFCEKILSKPEIKLN